jgi:hypothetical protein
MAESHFSQCGAAKSAIITSPAPICFDTPQKHAWREDARRGDNGSQVRRVTQLALSQKPSVDFSGYYQRHLKAA